MDKATDTLTMDEIITGLCDIKTTVGGGRWDICQAAVNILFAIKEEGAQTIEDALDILHDYRLQAKQYKALHSKHEVAGKPFLRGCVWCCPSCNRWTTPNHSYCHCCGKKLGWR